MLAPEIPRNEEERLLALKAYNILDTLPEEEYDAITKIAAQICGTPIALISLVDKDRQWFKSKQGLGAVETPRDISFCGHAINTPDKLFEVENSLEDPRFFDNPLATGDPHVVFYAGFPLVTPDGEAVGTLCVIDNKPGKLSIEARDTLNLLAKQVITTLELRKQNQKVELVNASLSKEIAIRKEREEELVKARDKALHAEKAKDQFLSNMSHEIRTPMNGIMGLTNLLLEEESIPKEQIELLRHIDFSARHLLRIINDILDLSVADQHKFTFEHTNFDLPKFLHNVIQLLKVNAEAKGVELELVHDAHIPVKVIGDSNRLGQILLNIVGNAIKFTEKGKVCVKTKLLLETSTSTHIQFEVVDTGIGISADKVDAIFEPFVQSDGEINRKYGGTGLGLTIAKSLIEQFGGSIEVESKVGKGSTFRFSVKLKQSLFSEEGEANFTQTGARSPEEPIHILLVEDNMVNQIVAKKHLAKMGFSVHTVDNGKKAVEAVAKDHYDLILMDINMPIMNGLDATRNIRNSEESYKDIKIIALTASILRDNTEKYFEAGIDAYIPKPFDPQVLKTTILDMVE
ncbi:MAG: ATP-binding protein [Bacteroidota bacterium]